MLEVQSLSKTFDSPLFAPVDLSLQPGEVLQVLGPNGVGKTTFLKCLAGYLSCEFKALNFCGAPLAPEQVAFATTDERAFFPKLSLMENFLFFKRFYGSNESIDDWGSELELTAFIDQKYQLCSTGIKKRASLLRALLKSTPILLLDEPFANMDPQFHSKLQQSFKRLCSNQGKILIFTSHALLSDQIQCQTLNLKSFGEA